MPRRRRACWAERWPGGVGHAAPTLPEDRADAMYHVYDGGGLKAYGPAVLVRKKLGENLSLSGSYYIDMVSNASIDVVTTASPYKETRNEYNLGADYIVRDATISVSTSHSKEPDYVAAATSIDIAQEVFGNMTTVSLGFTRAWDQGRPQGPRLLRPGAPTGSYRLGLTQVLTKTSLTGQRQLRGRGRRRLPRQPLPRGAGLSAPPCPSATRAPARAARSS